MTFWREGLGKWEASVAEGAERTMQIGVKQEMSGLGGHNVSRGVRGLCLHPKNRGVLGEVTRFRLMFWDDVWLLSGGELEGTEEA